MPDAPIWRGEFVELAADGKTWRFHTCLRCHAPLKTPNHDGFGPECRNKRALDWRRERREALAKDRAAYRADRSSFG